MTAVVQGRMLDELDEDVDTTHSRLRATQKKVGLLLHGTAAANPAVLTRVLMTRDDVCYH